MSMVGVLCEYGGPVVRDWWTCCLRLVARLYFPINNMFLFRNPKVVYNSLFRNLNVN